MTAATVSGSGETVAADEIPEPKPANTRTDETGLRQIPEPTASRVNQRVYQIPEPMPVQIPEPLQFGLEIDTDILSNHTRLWRLECYADRHGKVRARRVLRFVARPEPRQELGQVSANLAEELKQRPGSGRHQRSRDEAQQFRRIAQHIAERLGRDKRLRRGRPVLQRSERIDNSITERGNMPQSQDDALWDNVSNVLM